MATDTKIDASTSSERTPEAVLRSHGRRDDPVADHAVAALRATDDPDVRFHLREVLQLRVAAEH